MQLRLKNHGVFLQGTFKIYFGALLQRKKKIITPAKHDISLNINALAFYKK